MKNKEVELNKKKEELEQRRNALKREEEELMLEEGKAYRCKDCGKISMRNTVAEDYEKEGVCFTCWSKKVMTKKRDTLMQALKDAKIIDIIPDGNPYSDISEVEKIVLEADGKRYEIKLARYGDEHYIEIAGIYNQRGMRGKNE